MTLKKQFVRMKIEQILKDLEMLAKYKDLTVEEIAKDYFLHKAIERILEVIITEAIDINQHMIAETGKVKIAFDYSQSFLELGRIGVFPKDFARRISKSVGLRNILAHQYRELDEKIFFGSIKSCLVDYKKYCQYVGRFLEKRYVKIAS